MKRTLQKVVNEFRQGKNILHHLSVGVAVGVPAARLLGLIQTDWFHSFLIFILGLLMAKSIQNEWLFAQIQPKLSGNPIKVYQHWNTSEVHQALASARRSFALIQTWFPDASPLADTISDLASSHSPKHPLRLEIYMMDPACGLGARRVQELRSGAEELDQGISQALHESHFEHSKKGFTDRLAALTSLDLSIYAYSCLPALKLYVIDEQDYLFSWFGLDGPSTRNVCFQVSARSGSAEVDRVVEKINAHLKHLKAYSRQVWPPETAQTAPDQ